jgi:hypothetical protein
MDADSPLPSTPPAPLLPIYLLPSWLLHLTKTGYRFPILALLLVRSTDSLSSLLLLLYLLHTRLHAAAAASHSCLPSFPTADRGEATSAAGYRGRTPAISPSPAHRVGHVTVWTVPAYPHALRGIELRIDEPPFVLAASRCCT